jgi:hypothetical protein
MGKQSRNKRHTPKMPRPATTLAADLAADAPPLKAAFDAALERSNPCAGKPAGTPCFVWRNPDGSTTVCTCDGNGNCVFPT